MSADSRRSRPSNLRVGVDVQSIDRFDSHSGQVREALRDRVFTPREREYCEGTTYPPQHYAARWAAKEAFLKLLDDAASVPVGSVEVQKRGDRPVIVPDTTAAEALCDSFGVDSRGDVDVDVSISHDRDRAVAVAQLVGLATHR